MNDSEKLAIISQELLELRQIIADLAFRLGNLERGGERFKQYTSTAMPAPEWEPGA